MVMNGFDTNFDRANEVYAVNTIPFAYMHDPLTVRRGDLVRMYIVNVLEYDLINSFHLHGNLFDWYPTGTSKQSSELTDTVMLCQGQRGIAEVRFPTRGAVHVPRAPVRVHRARLAGLLRGDVMTATATPKRRVPAWALGLGPLLLIVAAVGLFAALGGPGLGERRGPPAEEARRRAHGPAPGEIELTVRNDGPDAVVIAQAIVNDAFAQFSGRRRADRPPRDGDAARAAAVGRGRGVRGRRCSPPRAGRSCTRSRSRSRRPTTASRSSG